MSFISAESFTNWKFYKELRKQHREHLQLCRHRAILFFGDVIGRPRLHIDGILFKDLFVIPDVFVVSGGDEDSFDHRLEELDKEICVIMNNVFVQLEAEAINDYYKSSSRGITIRPNGETPVKDDVVIGEGKIYICDGNGNLNLLSNEPGVVYASTTPWYLKPWNFIKNMFR